MNFNVDRIAVLAGLASSGKSGLMKEGAAPVTPAPAAKPPAPSAPAAKAPPAPAKAAAPAPAAPAKKMEEDDYEEGYEGYMAEEMEDEANEMYHDSMGGMSYGDDLVYEVDETQLMEALVDMREKRLQESRFRTAVREELSTILNNKEAGSRWLYGNRQPTNSGKGKVARGFLGPGFR